jgi:hypothetical protein
VRLWSLPDGRALAGPLRFPYGAADAQLSSDGRWLSVVALDRDVAQDRLEIWDVGHRQRLTTLRPAGGSDSGGSAPTGGSLPSAVGAAARRCSRRPDGNRSRRRLRAAGLPGRRSPATGAPSPPGTPTERSASGTSQVARRSAAAAARHTQLAGRADLHTRPHTPHRGLPERSRLPLGHPNRFACPPGMPRRRVQAHARGMRRVPARAGV